MVSERVMAVIGGILRPMQLGYGTKSVAELAVHASRSFLIKETENLKVNLDLKNAFSTIRRDKLLYAAPGYDHQNKPEKSLM